MEVERALQILSAQQTFDVVLEGDSVWIDDVNPDTRSATVHSLRDHRVMQVDVRRLHEP
ncbi:hypothetical protein GCM10025857_17200 [Alicyclobacillus contaminans]|uniref:small, acid-soluble spore protein, H family n=1 Tax=Alicyclobacillus contaminans TaxID=392016 RepID=UPI0004179C6C|nr:small, acid-soluble spore protein, H family [Alicyclobacillus contaminans]GMA50363.1 hypothetical protein GCM10025857_17200 [Alicyclobacillus contaminans]